MSNTYTITDRLDVCDVIIQFAAAMDLRDWSLLATCFAEHVEADFSEATGQPKATLTNQQFVDAMKGLLDRPLLRTQHLISNQAVSFLNDSATCRSYYVADHYEPETHHRFTVHGWYLDTLMQGKTGWHITQRKIVARWSTGEPSIIGL